MTNKYVNECVLVAKSLFDISDKLERESFGIMNNPDMSLSKSTERNLIVKEIERIVSEYSKVADSD